MPRTGDRISFMQDGRREVQTLCDYLPEADTVLVRNDYGEYTVLDADEIEWKIEGRKHGNDN